MLIKSGGDEACRVGEGCLAALHFTEGFTYNLLGQASTFAALAGNAGRFTHFLVAAATFVDCFADLSVGDAGTQAHIHKGEPSRFKA